MIGGASKGLGFGCAKVLAERGYKVILCARKAQDVEAATRSLRESSQHAEVIAIPCDWSKRAGISFLKEEVHRLDLRVDVLVNNVGGPPPGIVTEISEAAWEEGLDLLFRSTVRLFNAFLPEMRERKWGRIINILSTTAIEPSPTLAVSSVLRAALASYAKLVAWEVAADGVTVNSVMPAGFRTARTEALIADSARRQNVSVETVQQQIEKNLPIHRLMDPAELGELVAFLASDAAAGITGSLLPMDGGQQKSI